MDIQFWIWLIVIVITLIARANKKKAQPFEPNHPVDNSSLPESKPLSFEDLLREIQAAKAPKPPKPVAIPLPPKQNDFIDYDDDVKDEIEEFERPDYKSQDKIYETYEKAKQQAFYRPSLEDTIKVGDTDTSFGQFKGYKSKERGVSISNYITELKNPAGFKKAFILSEILNRRY
ncbi:MAG: hypothetical protein KBF45_02100 [Cyclobacteriaceae bacterium]|jgi:cell division protein FtsN|nr:hypothetical protein [Cyclobacteriaceae bacterium]